MEKSVSVLPYVKSTIETYVGEGDWKTKENSNSGFSFPNLQMRLAGDCFEEYGLSEIYTERAGDLHRAGFIHLHDLAGSVAPYCAGWSLKDLLTEGLNGVPNKINSAPPASLESALGQMVNFLGVMSNEWMGAQAFGDVDVLLAPFLYVEMEKKVQLLLKHGLIEAENSYEMILEDSRNIIANRLQSMIYHLNTSSRWGGQPPFTNFTLDMTVPAGLGEEYAIHGGEYLQVDKEAFSYIYNHIVEDSEKLSTEDFDEIMSTGFIKYNQLKFFVDMFNELFFIERAKGTVTHEGFSFPVLTTNLTPELFDIPDKVKAPFAEAIIKYGDANFQNCINGESNLSKIDPDTSRSMCCRLQLDIPQINKHTGGLFGNGDYTGSVAVGTVSLPMIAADTVNRGISDTMIEFRSEVLAYMDIIKVSLVKKWHFVMDMYNKGLFEYTKRYLKTDFKTHFLTIGYIGMHEALTILGFEEGILDPDGKQFAMDLLDEMRGELDRYYEEHNIMFNLEAIPGEGAGYRLARKLVETYPEAYVSKEGDTPYFTNSCHPPAEYQGDMLKLLEHQEGLQNRHSGGTIVHFYLGEKLESEVELFNVLRTIGTSTIPFFTLTTVYSVCPICGYIPGEHYTCPNEHSDEDLEAYYASLKSEEK